MASHPLPTGLPHSRSAGRMRRAAQRGAPALESDLFATHLESDRELRVAANFCETPDEAGRLCVRLRALPGLSDAQVMLLRPVDSTPRRFAKWRQGWDDLRPRAQKARLHSTGFVLQASALTGLLLGLAGSLLADASPGETLAFTAFSTLVLLIIGWVLQALAVEATHPRRFDQALQERLAFGLYAVVVKGVKDPATARNAIAAMREVGVYWCAETPRRPA